MADDEPIDAEFTALPALPASILPPQLKLRGTGKRRHTENMASISPALPDYVEEVAFICYVKVGRVVKAAYALMREEWDALAPLQPDPETGELVVPPFPQISISALYRWRQRHHWDDKFNQHLAGRFPGINMEQTADLIMGRGRGLHFLIGAVEGVHDHLNPGTLASRIKAAEILMIAGGMGTHGNRDRIAPVVRAVVSNAPDFETMTEQELARYTLEAVRRSKTAIEERKR